MTSGPGASFSASYDSTSKIISAVTFVVLVGIVAAIQSVVVGCLDALILVAAYAWSPRGYAVSDRSILVKRLIGNVRIPLDGIREARAATADDFRGASRSFGNGGLFGYYGLFRTRKLGKCTWYVTNRSHAVVIVTAAKTALFSPDDVDAFLMAIRASVPVPAAPLSQPSLDAVRSPVAGSRGAMLIGVAIGVLVLGIVALALLYSPGPPGYTLTQDTLTIHDRFYPVTINAASVDVEHIRVIDLGVDTEWQPVRRTNGFGNPHYHSGWFRVASGKTIRMYRADSERMVLLPPKGDGTPVLLEATEPEKVVSEVKGKWSSKGGGSGG